MRTDDGIELLAVVQDEGVNLSVDSLLRKALVL